MPANCSERRTIMEMMTAFLNTHLHWLGLDPGFWEAMGVVVLIVILMNVVLWTVKPKN